MTLATNAHVYVLDTGETFTARQLGEKLKMTTTSARYRLNQSNISSWVLRGRNVAVKQYKRKIYTLTNGDKPNVVGSASELSELFNLNQATMYARLLRGIRDVKTISRRPQKGSQSKGDLGYVKIENQAKSIKADMKTRMFYDEKKHWQLFAKCT